MKEYEAIQELHKSPYKAVIVVAGGGTKVFKTLLEFGGGSNTLIEGFVPYSKESFDKFLGYKPVNYASINTARNLASAAFNKSKQLKPAARLSELVGVGCTCSLAVDNYERTGREHKVFVAIQTLECTYSYSLNLNRNLNRTFEESVASSLIIYALLEACKINTPWPHGQPIWKDVIKEIHTISEPIKNVMHYSTKGIALDSSGSWVCSTEAMTKQPKYIFPGAFNPLHTGHIEMMQVVSEIEQCGPIDIEISLTNVDKASLNYADITSRFSGFCKTSNLSYIGNIWFTNAPTFVEKVKLFPQTNFIVGVDTFERLGKLRYYRHDPAIRNWSFSMFEKYKAKFLVFDREINGKLKTLDMCSVPDCLKKLGARWSGSGKYVGLSSTKIRKNL